MSRHPRTSTEPASACRRPGAVAVTVAVNVTDWPNFDGFADDVSGGRRVRLLHFLVHAGRRAPVEARIAAVDRRDGVMAHRQRRRS